MSKYEPLWRYIRDTAQESLTLTFDQIGEIAGVPIDHAFLNCKKELTAYGYQVKGISMKARTVTFVSLRDGQ